MEIPFDLGVVVNVDGEEGPLNGQYLVLFYLLTIFLAQYCMSCRVLKQSTVLLNYMGDNSVI